MPEVTHAVSGFSSGVLTSDVACGDVEQTKEAVARKVDAAQEKAAWASGNDHGLGCSSNEPGSALSQPAPIVSSGINAEMLMQELINYRRELDALTALVNAKDQEIQKLTENVAGHEHWKQDIMAACEMPAKIYKSLLQSTLPTTTQPTQATSSEVSATIQDMDL